MRCMRSGLPEEMHHGNGIMKNFNILIVGVGGQGVILASDTLAEIGMENGFDVKKSDSIGMSQRGGSVVSHIRWGERVYSPMIKKGEVDYLVGLEKLEAVRSASYLKPGGTALIADIAIPPVSLISSTMKYPDDNEINGTFSRIRVNHHVIPVDRICAEAGNMKALNMVMLGALSCFMGLDESIWVNDIRKRLKPEFIDSSLRAFSLGALEIRNAAGND